MDQFDFDFLSQKNKQQADIRCETEEERYARILKETLQKEIQQEEKMIVDGEINDDLIMDRIERYIFDTNCDYFHLCEHALYSRPVWSRVIRRNTAHIIALIESTIEWRQHEYNKAHPNTSYHPSVKNDRGLR